MKLTPEEKKHLEESVKCTRCWHLEVFHHDDYEYDQYNDCGIEDCKCRNFTTRKGVKKV